MCQNKRCKKDFSKEQSAQPCPFRKIKFSRRQRIRDDYPESRIRIFSIPDLGSEFFSSRILIFYPSRIQGSKRHRIPDPDPQHFQELNFRKIFTHFQVAHFKIRRRNFGPVGMRGPLPVQPGGQLQRPSTGSQAPRLQRHCSPQPCP